jgi:hypothetical protein
MLYQIEFIRAVHGRGHSEVIHVSGGQFASVDDAIEQGKLLLSTLEATRRANGFRIERMMAISLCIGLRVAIAAPRP